MSNFDERGAYTPREEPLAFDARQPGGRGGGRAPTTLLISAAVLILLAAGVFFYYRSGVRHEGEAPRVLGQPVGQMTTPPPASSQPSDTAAGLEVYNTEQQAASSQPNFAPAPEQPLPRPAPPPVQPAPQATLPPAVAPAPAPTRPAASPAPAAVAPPRAAPLPVQPARPKTGPETAPATPMNIAAAGDTRAPASLAAAKAPPAPKPAASAAAGPGVVQIGAFSNAAQADKGWNDVARLLPGDMAGHGKRVEQVDVGGKTFQRTYVTGFSSKAAAQTFCRKLSAAGHSCIVR